MNDHTYKNVEITGTSSKGSDDAISNAIAKAAKSIEHMDWFEVLETRGHLKDGAIAHWQVTIKIGFRIED